MYQALQIVGISYQTYMPIRFLETPSTVGAYTTFSIIRLGSCQQKMTCIQFPPASLYMWVFPKIGVPQNGWFIMENPFKMDDLGVPLFLEPSISCYFFANLSSWDTLSSIGFGIWPASITTSLASEKTFQSLALGWDLPNVSLLHPSFVCLLMFQKGGGIWLNYHLNPRYLWGPNFQNNAGNIKSEAMKPRKAFLSSQHQRQRKIVPPRSACWATKMSKNADKYSTFLKSVQRKQGNHKTPSELLEKPSQTPASYKCL